MKRNHYPVNRQTHLVQDICRERGEAGTKVVSVQPKHRQQGHGHGRPVHGHQQDGVTAPQAAATAHVRLKAVPVK